jgi:NTP pyrophosphatase (non-canonical NTP hydrolase)
MKYGRSLMNKTSGPSGPSGLNGSTDRVYWEGVKRLSSKVYPMLELMINLWGSETFGVSQPETLMLKLQEELQELQEAVAEGDHEQILDEAADLFIVLAQIVHPHGSIEAAVASKMLRNLVREWEKQDNGTFKHRI